VDNCTTAQSFSHSKNVISTVENLLIAGLGVTAVFLLGFVGQFISRKMTRWTNLLQLISFVLLESSHNLKRLLFYIAAVLSLGLIIGCWASLFGLPKALREDRTTLTCNSPPCSSIAGYRTIFTPNPPQANDREWYSWGPDFGFYIAIVASVYSVGAATTVLYYSILCGPVIHVYKRYKVSTFLEIIKL
jgi:hypothetical protein